MSTILTQYTSSRKKKAYELSNHLGNVLTTISDMKVGRTFQPGEVADYYEAYLMSTHDYYPFGLEMPGRTWTPTDHRYGFNGKERDRQMSSTQTHYDYGFRIYNPAIGRFLSVDPLTKERNWRSPYNFVQNSPLVRLDPDGALDDWYKNAEGNIRFNPELNSVNAISILNEGEQWLGNAYTETTKNGINQYRIDGSILFGSNSDAVKYMTDLSAENVSQNNPLNIEEQIPPIPNEQFGFIYRENVLMTPSHTNAFNESRLGLAGYTITDDSYYDPIEKSNKPFDYLVHTHPAFGDQTPSYEDQLYLIYSKITKPMFVLGIKKGAVSVVTQKYRGFLRDQKGNGVYYFDIINGNRTFRSYGF